MVNKFFLFLGIIRLEFCHFTKGVVLSGVFKNRGMVFVKLKTCIYDDIRSHLPPAPPQQYLQLLIYFLTSFFFLVVSLLTQQHVDAPGRIEGY